MENEMQENTKTNITKIHFEEWRWLELAHIPVKWQALVIQFYCRKVNYESGKSYRTHLTPAIPL
jgi:hypothetical protein